MGPGEKQREGGNTLMPFIVSASVTTLRETFTLHGKWTDLALLRNACVRFWKSPWGLHRAQSHGMRDPPLISWCPHQQSTLWPLASGLPQPGDHNFAQGLLEPRGTHLPFVLIRSDQMVGVQHAQLMLSLFALPHPSSFLCPFSTPSAHIPISDEQTLRPSKDPSWNCGISMLLVDILNLMVDSLGFRERKASPEEHCILYKIKLPPL